MVSLNVPSSKGVSAGPKMTAFHCIMLLSHGAPLTPAGGSSWRNKKQCYYNHDVSVKKQIKFVLLGHKHEWSYVVKMDVKPSLDVSSMIFYLKRGF